MSRDTIFALSSGGLPAAIAIVRVSGPLAGASVVALAGRLPEPRRASAMALRDPRGDLLDRALVLWLPGPNTATGEDLAELHLHGSRAVVAAVLRVLGERSGLRPAEPGEFTRRALESGRLDLIQIEALADLLAAETEQQRRQALRSAEGGLSRSVAGWRERVLALSATIEASIEFSDEEDVTVPAEFAPAIDGLRKEIGEVLRFPPARRLRDGVRVVVAGPPNAGKSTLINSLAERRAALTSSVAGTTRDLIEVPIILEGRPLLLIDTAGIRSARGKLEQAGIELAGTAIAAADLVLWLGSADQTPAGDCIIVSTKVDSRPQSPGSDVAISAVTGEGLAQLRGIITARADALLPAESQIAVTERQRAVLEGVAADLASAGALGHDPLLAAEHLRQARAGFDRLVGKAGVEDTLDALFGQFCIGK